MPPGIDEAQMQRLEKESERLTTDIKHKEKENERLREQIASLKCQIQQRSKGLEEVTQGRQTAADQKLKMKLITECRKLTNGNDERDKKIVELRKQLNKLRMKTFPRITAAKTSDSLYLSNVSSLH